MPGRQGGNRVTLREVADHAQVSVATASRVLAGNYPVAAETRHRVEQSIQALDYVANVHARALAGVAPRTVAFVLPDIRAQAFAHAAQGVEEAAAEHGALCLICTTQGDPEREHAVFQMLREQRASAVILIGGVVDDAEYRANITDLSRGLATADSRLVLCGRPPAGDIPAIEYANESGAYSITQHLISSGHRRILFLGGPSSGPATTTVADRLAGYRRALGHPGWVQPADFTRESGYQQLCTRLPEDFTAVFAATDLVAAGARAALHAHGLRVPEDVSLVGYDDLELAEDLGLTTVRVPYEDLGRAAVRLALSGREHSVLETSVVVRTSVAPL
ncbi:LacI family transcriptional regulator [Amycolatopsis sp. FU40]|uniref:LacI family DNA-binding transcriptional regulator n=1 Tax=Amycolatopsis sp. FU40 TaxID=2914159 RepID=UPI001F211982|nr:LacI family DNA-binding transcriptional regulator [Amycolatopsis sp. FU40]UKD54631.1 LacI family transcriptional regulator [Amycolatopsis sp. FU40]